MAVLWQTSWDFVAAADVATLVPYAYSPQINASGPVGNYIYLPDRIFAVLFAPSGVASIWFHARIKVTYDSNYIAFSVSDTDGARQLVFWIDPSYHLRVYRSDNRTYVEKGYITGTLLGTGTVTLKEGQWYAFEGEITINSSTGVVKTWVNGEPDLNLTGQNTQRTANANIAWMSFCEQTGVDDVVISDANSPNASHPGELRVDCMMPNANGTDRANGGSGEMTRSTGSDDYTLMDETAASTGTGDYIYADAVGEKCSLNVAALTNTGGTIVAVQCTVYATKNEAGPCGFKIYCLRGGSRYYSGEFFPSFGSWSFFQKVWDQDPSTSAAWTESNFNAAEFGVERTT